MKKTIETLTHIYSIHDFYSKGRGEEFSLFELLNINVNNKEWHNNLIAELLNVHGKHAANDAYLKIFCKIFSIHKLPLNSDERPFFKPDKFNIITNTWIECRTKKEKVEIPVDICIKVNEKTIYIINLMLGGNNLRQEDYSILEVKNYHDLIFLTVNDIDRIDDKSDLFRTRFFMWLQECINFSTTRPVVRENLLQYFKLISRLTKNSSNMEMTKDMIKAICSNNESINAVLHIIENVNLVKRKIMDIVVYQLYNQLLIDYNFYIRDEFGEKDSFCQFIPKGWKEYHIAFLFKENYSKLRVGISNMSPDMDFHCGDTELERQLHDRLGDVVLGKVLNCNETDFVWLTEFDWFETALWGDIYAGKFVEQMNIVVGNIVNKTRGIAL